MSRGRAFGRGGTARMVTGAACAVCVVSILASGDLRAAEDSPQTETRRVYVSALDRAGAPVSTLAPGDLEIKVAGKTQPAVDIRRAEAPLRVAVLVADGGTGAFQLGLHHFVRRLAGQAEVGFTSVVLQPERLGGYARDLNGLIPLVARLGPRGGGRTGGQLVEAIYETAQTIKVEASRSAIVVLRVGGEAPSDISSRLVRSELAKSGAILYVFSTAGANRPSTTRAPTTAGGDSVARIVAQNEDAEDVSANLNLNLILGDGARESGGRHDEILSTTAVALLEGLASELLGQFEVTYTIPPSVRPQDRISVSSTRRGLTVRAPAR